MAATDFPDPKTLTLRGIDGKWHLYVDDQGRLRVYGSDEINPDRCKKHKGENLLSIVKKKNTKESNKLKKYKLEDITRFRESNTFGNNRKVYFFEHKSDEYFLNQTDAKLLYGDDNIRELKARLQRSENSATQSKADLKHKTTHREPSVTGDRASSPRSMTPAGDPNDSEDSTSDGDSRDVRGASLSSTRSSKSSGKSSQRKHASDGDSREVRGASLGSTRSSKSSGKSSQRKHASDGDSRDVRGASLGSTRSSKSSGKSSQRKRAGDKYREDQSVADDSSYSEDGSGADDSEDRSGADDSSYSEDGSSDGEVESGNNTDITMLDASDSDDSLDNNPRHSKVRPSVETPTPPRTTVSRPAEKVHGKPSTSFKPRFSIVAKHIYGGDGKRKPVDGNTICLIMDTQTKHAHERYEFVRYRGIKKNPDYKDNDLDCGIHTNADRFAMDEFGSPRDDLKHLRLKNSPYVVEGVVPLKTTSKDGGTDWKCTVVFSLREGYEGYKRLEKYRKKYEYFLKSPDEQEIYRGPIRCSITQFTKAGGNKKDHVDPILRNMPLGRAYLEREKNGRGRYRDSSMTHSPEPEEIKKLAEAKMKIKELEEQVKVLTRKCKSLKIR